MIFSIYTDGKKQTFEGFDFVKNPVIIGNGSALAITFFEEQVGMWLIDTNCPIAVDELKRFYRMLNIDATIQIWTQPGAVFNVGV